MNRLGWLLCLAAVAGCRCDGGPAQGQCTGTWGGVEISAKIDPDSRYVTIYPATCGLVAVHLFQLHYESSVSVEFEPLFTVAVISPKDVAIPSSEFKTFTLTPMPEGTSGTMHISIEGIYLRRSGRLELTAPPDQKLSCTFELPSETEGADPCPHTSSGGHDFD